MCAHILCILFSVPDTGVDTYKYEKLLYSPLHTLHRILQRHESDWAKTQVDQGEALGKALHMRHSQLGEFSESWGA